MRKSKKKQRNKQRAAECLNRNCWLNKSLNYAPYKRCQYCELKFRDCLFLHYQIVSLILILFFVVLSFLVEGKVSQSLLISVFTLMIVYGYLFNKSTDKIIKANFTERKAKKALEALTQKLEEKVDEQTKEITQAYKKVEKAYALEKHAHRELKRLDEAKSLFLSIASHQLRTPLSGIKGFLAMILDRDFGDVPAKIRDVLSEVYANTNRLIRLVSTFLDVSRIESGRLNLFKSNVDMVLMAQKVIGELQFEAQERGLKLSLKFSHPKIFANVDVDKIEDALINIIDNAIKYTAKGGVEVRALDQNHKIRFEVEDTGQGLRQQEIKDLFHKFVRGDRAIMLHADGSGIGLYIAKQIIEMHKGEIGVKSEGTGKGSVFWFEVPR